MKRALLLAAVAVACKSGGRDEGGKREPAAVRDAGPPPAARTAAGDPIPPAPPLPEPPPGIPPVPSPEHNPSRAEKLELGRLLFFETRLSSTGAMSCASCHQPEHGFADGAPRSKTAGGQLNLRHTPSLWNAGYQRTWAWDGSMPTLEAHILSHWKGQLGAEPETVASALGRAPGYAARFERAFGGDRSRERVAEALAVFVRFTLSAGSPWDRHEASERGAASEDAVAGFRVFSERAGCAVCHPPPLYGDLGFHARRAVGEADPGRARVTGDAADQGAFKTPGLRGLVHTAPYFHDGGAATLEDAVDAELATSSITLDAREREQLLAFLRALSPPVAPQAAPTLPAVP